MTLKEKGLVAYDSLVLFSFLFPLSYNAPRGRDKAESLQPPQMFRPSLERTRWNAADSRGMLQGPDKTDVRSCWGALGLLIEPLETLSARRCHTPYTLQVIMPRCRWIMQKAAKDIFHEAILRLSLGRYAYHWNPSFYMQSDRPRLSRSAVHLHAWQSVTSDGLHNDDEAPPGWSVSHTRPAAFCPFHAKLSSSVV